MFATILAVTLVAQTTSTGWPEVDGLMNEQKYEAASTKLEQRLASARTAKNDTDTARALIALTQTRAALGGAETALARLHQEAWPQSSVPRALVELYFAASIENYLGSYSWEIGQREKVDTKGQLDLKRWTADQLRAEIQRTAQQTWLRRSSLGAVPLVKADAKALGDAALLRDLLHANDYPPGVRDTLRDAVSYLRARSLADSAGWTAEAANTLYQLELSKLLAGDVTASAKLELLDASVHPLLRAMAVLDDLEAWHLANKKSDAALNARIERFTLLHNAFTEEKPRRQIRVEFERVLEAHAGDAMSAHGREVLANFVSAAGEPAKARDIAAKGARAFPQTVGGQACAALVTNLERPDYGLSVVAVDGLNKRSVDVNAKNLSRLFLRAYRVDPSQLPMPGTGFEVLPGSAAMYAALTRKPDVAWSVDLPATPDLQPHRTIVTPPLETMGAYLVIASVNEGFVDSANRLLGAVVFISDLVLETLSTVDGAFSVVVREGATGAPLKGVEVQLWTTSWNEARRKLDSKTSDADGLVRLSPSTTDRNYFVVAKRGADVVVDSSMLYAARAQEQTVSSALVFTDRAIYRPNQTIKWKIVAYQGSATKGQFAIAANTETDVVLRDTNWQEVAKAKVRTNGFGSASGEFLVPSGRLLGQWQVQARGASSYVRVEEYKRPTFEVSFKAPTQPMRLNAKASLTGEARYYFGLPVSAGRVQYRVRRTPMFPWWWWWGTPPANPQVIAAGTTALKADGTFEVLFTPEADPDVGREVSFSYEIEADVTDEGGETRSTSRSVRLGLVSIEAQVSSPRRLFLNAEPVSFDVRRTDLNGVGRAGKGAWRIMSLKQPAQPILPADEAPLRAPGAKPALVTAGDEVRPRANPGYDPTATVRSWVDDAEAARGTVVHDADGNVRVVAPKLDPGVWRLRYETTDEAGAPYSMSTDFFVVGAKAKAQLPFVFMEQEATVEVGDKARFFAWSGFAGQPMLLEVFRAGVVVERRWLKAQADGPVIERSVGIADRGGFTMRLTAVRDYQVMTSSLSVSVPWSDKALALEFSTFRDALKPGSKETFRVMVKDHGKAMAAGGAEVIASMYDQSLDAFVSHQVPSVVSLYPSNLYAPGAQTTQHVAGTQWLSRNEWFPSVSAPSFREDELTLGWSAMNYRFRGGPGGLMLREERPADAPPPPPAPEPAAQAAKVPAQTPRSTTIAGEVSTRKAPTSTEAPAPQVRSNFSETAFYAPHLVVDASGQVGVEFEVPDSVTAWTVWAEAFTKDLRGGQAQRTTRTVKELMVRPYVPRFLREGDELSLKVAVNNGGKTELTGELRLELLDPDTQQSVAKEFGLEAKPLPFSVKAGQGTTVTVALKAPKRVGMVAFKVVAKAGELSDGELRPVPLLPSRMHLTQSRFVSLTSTKPQTLTFDALAKNDDPTRLNEQLVVTVDAQLLYSVLTALPYLQRYPYECTEQTMNRFVSTSLVASLFAKNPALAKIAATASKRTSPLETFDDLDPNRKLQLEESPWLQEAQGSRKDDLDAINLLRADVVEAERQSSLAKLRKAQLSNGGFSWFPGGPPSPYITLVLLQGFARAAEFGVDVPKDMVVRAWSYVASDFRGQLLRDLDRDVASAEFTSLLAYTMSSFPDASWTDGSFSAAEKTKVLSYSLKHWKELSRLTRASLALALNRAKRGADAKLVFDSVMDSAKTNANDGTFWQAEDRAWLWYQDTIESHAMALRTLQELNPNDERRAGLVQWLFLNKKLGHWKSTRATAEVLHSLVKYLSAEGLIGKAESTQVTLGSVSKTFEFDPAVYSGRKNQVVVAGPDVTPVMAKIVVTKKSQPLQFASATWQFSTDQLPSEGSGDLLHVSRTYFKRVKTGAEVKLQPLAEGATLIPGDELEVQLSIRARQAMEYVHLRDPRGAGFEPGLAVSRYRYDLGLGWYEEFRDSGTNFFFEALPPGEYTLSYRVRAAAGGTFRVGPATLQSIYAPEFAAYSAGHVLKVMNGGK